MPAQSKRMPGATAEPTPSDPPAATAERSATDRQLLECFIDDSDEAAFDGLVRRHRRVVWGVCRRFLPREQDAEDAFQAVFLILARKARAIRKREAVGSWLYGVAYRTALRARRALGRSPLGSFASLPGDVPSRATGEPWHEAAFRELQQVLDEEVQRLPDKYRAPFVLCCLEGMSRGEAARALGWKLGTLSGRLSLARQRLVKRLARRGVKLSAALTAAALATNTAAAAAPTILMHATANGALATVTGTTAGTTVSPAALTLAETVIRTMTMAKLRTALATFLALSVFVAGVALAAIQLTSDADALDPHAFVEPPRALGAAIDEQVMSVAFSPDGSKLVTAGGRHLLPGQLQIWDVTTRKNLVTIRGIPGVRTVAFAPDGQSFATGDFSGQVKLRDATTGRERAAVKGHGVGVNSVAYSPDGTLLVSAGLDRTLKLWSVNGLQERKVFRGHKDMVFSATFFHHAPAIVSGSKDKNAIVWDANTGAQMFVLQGHGAAVEAVAVSPDDKIVATASWDRTIKLWDAASGKEMAVLDERDGEAYGLCFSPDGKLLASARSDGKVRLWDMKTWKLAGEIGKHAASAWAVAFSHDGKLLASGSSDRTAKLWHVPGGKEAGEMITLSPFVRPIPVLAKVNPVVQQDVIGKDVIRKEGQAPKENITKEYYQSLKGKLTAETGLRLKGPGAEQCLNFADEGLRITLPTGYVGERPITGLATNFGVKGDFEITLNYEILQEPERADAGESGTRLTLGIALNKANKNLANFSRKISANSGPHYAVWSNTTDKDKPNSKSFPTKAKSGRLRLARTGNILSYYASEGAENEFILLRAFPFGAEDLREIRITGNTGGEKASLDVRITDLRIRAAALLKTPQELAPPPLQPAPPPRALAERVEFPFREGLEKQPMLRLVGPEVEPMVKVDAQGLRLTVPAKRLSGAPVGVESGVRLRGDFEITLAYELLTVPNPAPDLGAGLAMRVEFDTPNSFQAHLVRTHTPKGEGAGANYSTTAPDGSEPFKGLAFRPMKAPRGRLRLVRTGAKLIYQIADGGDSFQVLATKEFGSADVIAVRAQGTTGWQAEFGVEVRFAGLELRADKISVPVPRVLPEHFEFRFADGVKKYAHLRLVGPEVAPMAKTDARGLHFIVPADRESGAQVGVESKMRLRGDFEITLAFELLAVPNPAPDLGAGLDMRVEFDSADLFNAHIGRVQNRAGAVVGANYITTGPDGNESFKGITVRRVKEPGGRLRLVRTGKKLIYQFADGGGGFQELATRQFANADVIAVRALCTTGWQTKSGVEVRLINLDLRSEQMPNKDAPPPPNATDEPDVPARAGKPKTWLVLAGLVLGFLIILLAGSIFLWFVVAKRRDAGTTPAVSAASSPIIVACPGCRKKLKIKAALAGKKLTCPQCGKGFQVVRPEQ